MPQPTDASQSQLFESLVSLIVKTSTDLPPDVRAAMRHAVQTEEPSSRAGQALNIISQNIDQAADVEGAICQDTGMPTFEIKTPVGVNQIVIKKLVKEAIAEATRRGKLRPNSVDSITGENTGNNLGPGMPVMHVEQWERDDIEVKLLLKGGAALLHGKLPRIRLCIGLLLPHRRNGICLRLAHLDTGLQVGFVLFGERLDVLDQRVGLVWVRRSGPGRQYARHPGHGTIPHEDPRPGYPEGHTSDTD